MPKSTNGEETKMKQTELNQEVEHDEGSMRPQVGTWNKMQVYEKKPQIKWLQYGEKHILLFNSEPKEIQNKERDGVFYVFDVNEGGEEKVLLTSAWSMLRGLKNHEPLTGKTFDITKNLVKGRQSYFVELVSAPSSFDSNDEEFPPYKLDSNLIDEAVI